MGDVCPSGNYCPLGTTTPMACGAGTFSNETGLAECHECPAGYYCLNGEDLNYVTHLSSCKINSWRYIVNCCYLIP